MKQVRKLVPVDYLDMLGMEGWLEDMSRRGLHYAGCDAWSALFERREPAATRWHAEPNGSAPKGMVGEQVRYSAQRGWLCAGRLGRFDLYWTDDPEADDFHTDPVAQSYTLDKLSRRMRKVGLVSALMLAALAALFLFARLDSAFGLVQELVDGTWLYLYLMVFLEFVALTHFLWNVRGLRRLRRQLREGVPAPHGRGWRRTGLVRQVYSVLTYVVALGALCSAVYSFTGYGRWKSELASLDRPAPVLSLAALEGIPAYVPDPMYYPGYEGPDRDNFVRYEWHFLSSHFEVTQTGFAPGSEDRVRLDMEWYDLRFAPLASPLLRDLMDYRLRDLEYQPERYAVEELTAPGFDRLVLARDVAYGGGELFASAGDRVLYLDYSGERDLAEHLDLVAEVLGWEG